MDPRPIFDYDALVEQALRGVVREALSRAALHGLPWEGGPGVVAMPVLHVFDPYSGCAYLYDIARRAIGIPDWLTGQVRWQPYAEA